MNTRLEKLFEQYQFSLKDKYDFLQIYNLLPDYKKVRVIEDFNGIAEKIHALRSDLELEQEILFGTTLKNIEDRLRNIKKGNIVLGTKQDISSLRYMI